MYSCYIPWYHLGQHRWNWCCSNPGYLASCYTTLKASYPCCKGYTPPLHIPWKTPIE